MILRTVTYYNVEAASATLIPPSDIQTFFGYKLAAEITVHFNSPPVKMTPIAYWSMHNYLILRILLAVLIVLQHKTSTVAHWLTWLSLSPFLLCKDPPHTCLALQAISDVA
ncbi:hypothetical protein ScPMuIL_018019 [Solemya velum]